jgi:hypothetical protein
MLWEMIEFLLSEEPAVAVHGSKQRLGNTGSAFYRLLLTK